MPRGIPRNPTQAKNNPVIKNTSFDTADQVPGQGSDRVMSSTGDAKESLEPNLIVRTSEFIDPEKMAILAFMNEPVTIRIGTTTDKNAAQVFETNINGNLTFFRRGATLTVKRYVVDHLLRLKETVYSQQEVVNAEGIREFVHLPHTALKYDFAMVRDDNPIGESWLRGVMAEPG